MKLYFLIFLVIIILGGSIVVYLKNDRDQGLKKTSAKSIKTAEAVTEVASQSNTDVITNVQFASNFSKSQIDGLDKAFYPTKYFSPAIYDVDKYVIKYKSLDEKNSEIEITSQLFVPKSANNQSFPVYVFGQGTTGLGDQCAPSKEQPLVDNWGNYQTYMLSNASQGYIVIFPDYEGFDDPQRLHHYFNARLEARVLLDGARATYEFFNKENLSVKAEQTVFIAGYSQGGHAAFAVSDIAATYAPELPIKGILSYGGTTNIANFLKENPALAPYLVYAYSHFYGNGMVDPVKILLPNLLPTLEETVTTTCIGKIYQKYSSDPKKIYNPAFYEALFLNNLTSSFPDLEKVFSENSSGLKKSNIPALILQGTTDSIVTVSSTKQFIEQACKAGNNITYFEYPGISHYQTRQVSFKDSLDWMKQLSSGEVPESYCKKL